MQVEILFRNIYLFTIASITYIHKLSVLKQYKIIILSFWKSVVQSESHWAKIKMLASLVPPRGSEKSICFYNFFSFLRSSQPPWLRVLSLYHSKLLLLFSYFLQLLTLTLLLPSYKNLMIKQDLPE